MLGFIKLSGILTAGFCALFVLHIGFDNEKLIIRIPECYFFNKEALSLAIHIKFLNKLPAGKSHSVFFNSKMCRPNHFFA